MPIIHTSNYIPPRYLFNGHFETIYPSSFRKVAGVAYRRERLDLPDGDFIDLDWARLPDETGKLVIVSHGLEGNSTRHYVTGTVKKFNTLGWDALAWNCRSCSGELNRLPRFYHHADTADLAAVIHHAIACGRYTDIALVGFSMGGNMTLKYLGEQQNTVAPQLKAAVAFSAPCDLPSSVVHLHKPQNRFYEMRFLRKLRKKIKAKALLFPDLIDSQGIDNITRFREFDERYTAPLHGFQDADDFYQKASSGPYTPLIKIPTLLINAQNDPFLTPECFPIEAARNNPLFYLEMPRRGGHVGFILAGQPESWGEGRAAQFVLEAMA
jgi:uncharacterized protein